MPKTSKSCVKTSYRYSIPFSLYFNKKSNSKGSFKQEEGFTHYVVEREIRMEERKSLIVGTISPCPINFVSIMAGLGSSFALMKKQ